MTTSTLHMFMKGAAISIILMVITPLMVALFATKSANAQYNGGQNGQVACACNAAQCCCGQSGLGSPNITCR